MSTIKLTKAQEKGLTSAQQAFLTTCFMNGSAGTLIGCQFQTVAKLTHHGFLRRTINRVYITPTGRDHLASLNTKKV